MGRKKIDKTTFPENEKLICTYCSITGEGVYFVTENIRVGEFYLYKKQNNEFNKLKTSDSPLNFKEAEKFLEKEREKLNESD